MGFSKISGNQISTATEAIISTLSFLNTDSVFRLPSGTEAQRPTGPSVGTIRFNTTTDNAEIYVADAGAGSAGWTTVAGGGPSLGEKVSLEQTMLQLEKILLLVLLPIVAQNFLMVLLLDL